MILYKNKYLKYKNKYLDLKKILGGAKNPHDSCTYALNNYVHVEEWAKKFRALNINIQYDIDKDIKYNENKKYNISNLTISRCNSIPLPESITEILKSLKKFNITCDLILRGNQIKNLPYEFCNIIIGGNLYLDNNNLITLPQNFYNIKVGGNLHLDNNNLTTLPGNFGNIRLSGDLNLSYNRLKILPKIFYNIKVGGNLYLDNNNLTTLPENFYNIKVGGNLHLDNNNLTTLPELPVNFENIRFSGDLNLSHNLLTTLPISFKNIEIIGSLFLENNQLKKLHDNLNINVNGDLNLSHNLLKILPENIVVGRDFNLSQNLRKILPKSFENIVVGGNLNLSYNLLKILPKNIININNKILLNNNYIISPPPYNCEITKQTHKNFCNLKNQTIEHSFEIKECSICQIMKICKKCAICKIVWYCSEKCEISAWAEHSIICNNIINTTFCIVAHGIMVENSVNIINDNNINIITLSTIGKATQARLIDPIIDIYKKNKTLYNNNDTLLHKLTDAGRKFQKFCKTGDNLEYDCKIQNRKGGEHFNNQILEFYDDNYDTIVHEYIESRLKINCFKKYENGKLEIDNKYLFDRFNPELRSEINSGDLINQIINLERGKNNRGHITFIIAACRKFNSWTSNEEKELMKVNSRETDLKRDLSRADSWVYLQE